MGVMDKFLNAMQLNDNTYENEDEFYDDGVEEEVTPVKVSAKQDDVVEEKWNYHDVSTKSWYIAGSKVQSFN